MVTGTMGDVVFLASSLYTQTFYDFNRTTEARWTEHEIIGNKPIAEYIGPTTDKVKLKIRLSADLGVNPETATRHLRKMCETGAVFAVIIGGRPLSNELWAIDALGEAKEYYDGCGRTISSVVDVSLREYPVTNEVLEVP